MLDAAMEHTHKHTWFPSWGGTDQISPEHRSRLAAAGEKLRAYLYTESKNIALEKICFVVSRTLV